MSTLVTERYLRETKLPAATDTYTVISHGFIIDNIREQLKLNNFKVIDEEYNANLNGNVATGCIRIENNLDPDMGMVFKWINSYNKKVKFSCSVGGFIYDIKSTMAGRDTSNWIRKHTGTALEDAQEVIADLISHANEHFKKIIDEKNKMLQMPMSNSIYGKIMGTLFFEKELLNSTHCNAIKAERERPTQDYKDKDTLWGLYKIIMFGISESQIIQLHQNQPKIHHSIMLEYVDQISEEEYDEKENELQFPLERPSGISGHSDPAGVELGHDDTDSFEADLAQRDLEEEEIVEQIPEEEIEIFHSEEFPDVFIQTKSMTIEEIKEEYGSEMSDKAQKVLDNFSSEGVNMRPLTDEENHLRNNMMADEDLSAEIEAHIETFVPEEKESKATLAEPTIQDTIDFKEKFDKKFTDKELKQKGKKFQSLFKIEDEPEKVEESNDIHEIFIESPLEDVISPVEEEHEILDVEEVEIIQLKAEEFTPIEEEIDFDEAEIIEETIDEKPSCDNCGSEEVQSNSSDQVICDNCGHEEETTKEEELDEFDKELLNFDTTQQPTIPVHSEPLDVDSFLNDDDDDEPQGLSTKNISGIEPIDFLSLPESVPLIPSDAENKMHEAIQLRMQTLYGYVAKYTIKKHMDYIAVTIDQTQESFTVEL